MFTPNAIPQASKVCFSLKIFFEIMPYLITANDINNSDAASRQVTKEENPLLFLFFVNINNIVLNCIKFYIEYTKRFVLQN